MSITPTEEEKIQEQLQGLVTAFHLGLQGLSKRITAVEMKQALQSETVDADIVQILEFAIRESTEIYVHKEDQDVVDKLNRARDWLKRIAQ